MILQTRLQKLQWDALVALAKFVLNQRHPWVTSFNEEDENCLFDIVNEDNKQRRDNGK